MFGISYRFNQKNFWNGDKKNQYLIDSSASLVQTLLGKKHGKGKIKVKLIFINYFSKTGNKRGLLR